MIYESTGYRQDKAEHVREVWNWNGTKCIFYSGTAPLTADAAATGTVLCTYINNAAVAKVAQKIRFTPVTAGTTGTFSITLNGVQFTFTDDASPTVAEICTGLYRLINTGSGKAAKYFTNSTDGVITVGGRMNVPAIYQKFTLTDNATSLDIEAATAGVAFDYSATATGAGNSITVATVNADAYGLQFEAIADIATGILEKLATQTWSGIATATGIATHFRIVQDSDGGLLSTTQKRIQGTVGVTGADLNGNTVSFVKDATYVIDTLPISFPAS